MNAHVASLIPENEAERMAAVRRYDILDTPPDGAFDRVTAVAARRFNAPISIISIVDTDRIWFKSNHGAPVNQIGRDPGLCASAILSPDTYVVTNAQTDPRSLANPLVAGELGLRFYVGAPLRTGDGYNLGTLCVIDVAPRPIEQSQIDDLNDLASIVMDQMELRLSARRAVAQANLMAREIDHRVMNSLQFVSGLLAMQSRSVGVGEVADHLISAANRVAAVARVHANFYSGAAEEAPCLAFLRSLCADLAGISGRQVWADGDEEAVATTRIQPIGLIVNELVTNAAKYGSGPIEVRYEAAGDNRRLTVENDGVALPAEFDPAKTSGLGMKVIATLARQLGGELTAGRRRDGSGARFCVTFPA